MAAAFLFIGAALVVAGITVLLSAGFGLVAAGLFSLAVGVDLARTPRRATVRPVEIVRDAA